MTLKVTQDYHKCRYVIGHISLRISGRSNDVFILHHFRCISWLRGTVVERRCLAGELPCPTLDLRLMVNRPLQG